MARKYGILCRHSSLFLLLIPILVIIGFDHLIILLRGGPRVSTSSSDEPSDGRRRRRLASNTNNKFFDPRTVILKPSDNNNNANIDKKDVAWWHVHVDKLARPYKPISDRSWCTSTIPNSGIFYVKTPKTASSTAAAVTMQLSINVAQREFHSSTPCKNNAIHHVDYSRRQNPVLMWTTIRNPAQQALSQYYFRFVSRNGWTPNAHDQLMLFKRNRNYQINYIGAIYAAKHPTNNKKIGVPKHIAHGLSTLEDASPSQIIQVIDEIMNVYRLIALSERMDECLIVLKLLLNLEYEDIVNLGLNKQAGGYDDGQYNGQCIRVQKGIMFPEVQEYVSHEFQVQNYDYFLYAVAERSLELTIDELGRTKVEEQVKQLQFLQSLVNEQCADEAVVPCTKEGPPNPMSKTSCFFGDVGCGHECVQKTLKKYKEGSLLL